MPKMNTAKRGRPAKEATPEVVETQSNNTQTNNNDLSLVLQRLETLEAENAQYKKLLPKKPRRWNYDWPPTYAFRLYGGKPITGLRMTRNMYGVGNVPDVQCVVTTSDGEEHEMLYEQYAKEYVLSEGHEAIEVIERGGEKLYKFIYEGEEFTIPNSMLN